jgi:predicted O-methyltransferase YrrM
LQERQRDSNRQIAWRVLSGAARSSLTHRDELRYHVARDGWSTLKRFGATGIDDVEIREIPSVQDATVEGFIDDPNRTVLAALCRGVKARTFFEIGTNRGRTAWTVARNNPEIQVHTLDLPDRDSVDAVALDLNEDDRDFFVEDWDRGEAFAETPEAARIEQLWGDSARFDYSPYEGKIDFIFVDGAHSYSYVRNDTEAALRMLSEKGVIAWDDYPAIPGVYRYLNELAPTLDRRPFHIRGTRLVVYSRVPLLERVSEGDGYGRLHKA